MKKILLLFILFIALEFKSDKEASVLDTVSESATLGINTALFLTKYPFWKYNFLNQYSYLDIPNISLKFSEKPEGYNPDENQINVNPCFYSYFEPKANEWMLLHEIGHEKSSYTLPTVFSSLLQPKSMNLNSWIIKKARLYEDFLPQTNAQNLALMAIPTLFLQFVSQIQEQKADNFANEHADKDALIAAIQYFKTIDTWKKDAIKKYFPEYVANLPFDVTQYMIDPFHPSSSSRIEKIKKTLKARFNIDI